MDIHLLLQELNGLDLPANDFVIVSSGALAIRGIREAKDLDIIVTIPLWDEIVRRHPVTLNGWGVERVLLGDGIEILNPAQSIFGNSKAVPAQDIFDQADVFYGVRFINLRHLRTIKNELGREIDRRDVELIDRFLER